MVSIQACAASGPKVLFPHNVRFSASWSVPRSRGGWQRRTVRLRR